MTTRICHTAGLALVALLTLGVCAAGAQEPPPPTLPPPTQPPTPPATEPPPATPQTTAVPPTTPPAPVAAGSQTVTGPVAPPRAELTEGELRRRRDAIYLMEGLDRKSTRLNSSHLVISYAVL